MATASFDKTFTIDDEETALKFARALKDTKHNVVIPKRDLEKDSEKGMQLLRKALLRSSN